MKNPPDLKKRPPPPNLKSDAEIEAFSQELELSKKGVFHDVVQTVKKAAEKPAPHEQLLLSFMPTEMTRTSPFFPMARQEMGKERPYGVMTWTTSWGRITITGERLSIYDETVLLAILILAKKYKSSGFETSIHELCKTMGVAHGRDTSNAIWKATARLTKTGIETDVGVKKVTAQLVGTIISHAARNKETGKLAVKVNPYFLEMFAAGMTTSIDFDFRAGIKSDIGKALYRFLQGQRPFYTEKHFLISVEKLAASINLDVETQNTLRKRIRSGLGELKRRGYVQRWMIDKLDIVKVWRR